MKKVYSVSESIVTHTENYSKKNKITQSAVVESALVLFFTNYAKMPIEQPIRSKRGRPMGAKNKAL